VALVGPNGAGKSTIVSLLLGLYRPDAGRLLADGRPYDELDLDDVRRGIGVVLQDPLIFHGTIRENIAFGLPDAGDARVEEAAEWATAAAFVRRLPAGYETDVGAEGVRLSAGQRQRIAIARALLARPALVVLDEPATYLDAVATAALVANLAALPWRPALLVIGHDELLLPAVDRVYRLEDGATRIVELAEAVEA
jgi:ABC-type bacteriocin/lantibiotic exporter with double-glycine peptidase domain